tara:strand:- start:8338 stop:9240 length:903 start_codon:yes stop_codon:yes gene_type:complete
MQNAFNFDSHSSGSEEVQVEFNGVIVYWSLSEGTCFQTLVDGFDELGIRDCLPKKLNLGNALKRALTRNFPSHKYIIRPLGKGSGHLGYGIVLETEHRDHLTGDRRNTYAEELRVKVIGKGGLLCNDPNHPKFEAFSQDYYSERGKITAAQLGVQMVKVCKDRMVGTPLRQKGGVYWIPSHMEAKWDEIIRVVKEANPSHTFYKVRTSGDEDTVSAVCDGLIQEVETRLSELTASLVEEDPEKKPGKRALKTKRDSAQDLMEKVEAYSGILGKTFDDLKEKVEEVQATAAIALLQAMNQT